MNVPDLLYGRRGVLPHSFPGLMAMIIGARYLVRLPWDGGLKEHSQAATETLFASGRFPVFSDPTGTVYFHFL